jgi:hypothetical protein
LLKDLFGQVAGCFPRRETRQAASQMAAGLLMAVSRERDPELTNELSAFESGITRAG